MTIRIDKKLFLVITVIFSMLAVLYVGRGLQQLVSVSSSSEAKDLRTRWDEMRLVLVHKSPYEGTTSPSSYPPFTYPADILILWPPWSAARFYFALINLICLGFLAGWAYRTTARRDARFAAALATSIPATSAVSTGLGLGQNTIFYTTLLILALWLCRLKLSVGSGFMLGVAMSKISITLPFVLLFVFRKDWKVLVGVGAYIVGGTLLVCLWVHDSPLHLARLWIQSAESYACIGYSPATFLCKLGVSPKMAIRTCEMVVLLVAVITFSWLRGLPLVTLFGLAAGFGRLWTYHRVYDNFMLVILLVALADAYLRTERWELGVALLAVGSTLWLPPKVADIEAVQIMHLVIWSAAMVALAVWAPRIPYGTTIVKKCGGVRQVATAGLGDQSATQT
jgi:hypothetical protein